MREINGMNKFNQKRAKVLKLGYYGKFLREHGFTFTAYNLRHHYNIKNHHLGIPVSLIAKNLGHNVLQNTTTYMESQGLKSCLDALDDWQQKQGNVQDDNLSLEQQMQLLREENDCCY